jgi:sec-independent protein translocase protein TatA
MLSFRLTYDPLPLEEIMKILGMGVPELLIILVVVLLIFGPKNLPKLGTAVGKTIKGLRDGMGAGKKEVEEADEDATEVVEEVVVEASDNAEADTKKTVKKVVVKKAE